MDATTPVFAALGFAISAVLAGIKIWETFFSRSKFDASFTWWDLDPTELTLEFTIANTGHRADGIRAITIDTPTSNGNQSDHINDKLPIALQASGGISPAFKVSIRTDVATDPDTAIFTGDAKLVVTNSAGRSREFLIPNPYDHVVYGREG